ncbi:hypothetical protein [Anaerobutyricum soehngenii]|uniref:hypothetical protein n=1 Tax=Anaerobutyricum soehngenii TaxID=105843 RepID=UPI0032C1ABA7
MTVNDFLRSVIAALEEQTIEEQEEAPKKEQTIDEQAEAPKKEETNGRKNLSNAEFLTATLRFGIGEDTELLNKLIRDATPSNMHENQTSLDNSLSPDEHDNKEDNDNTPEEKEVFKAADRLTMAEAEIVELKRIIANLRGSNNGLAKTCQELRVENNNLRIENEALTKQCDSLSQELKRTKDDCDALKTAAQTIVKYLTQK